MDKDKNKDVRDPGPSGKPKLHFSPTLSRKQAKEAAREAGHGNPPIQHPPHKPGQPTHWHPTNSDGSKKKNGSHYPQNK
jgi:hypothetical protein